MQLPTQRLLDLTGIYGALTQVAGMPTPANVAANILATQRIKDAQLKQPVYIQTYISDPTNAISYIFDAVLEISHNTRRQITSHPVQFGASIAEHSYQEPAEVVLQIGMSDSMQTFNGLTPLTTYSIHDYGASNKSINAYKEFLKLQKSGNPLSLTTRLYSYTNMVIEEISVTDDYRTANALKCRISFKEVFIGKLGEAKISIYSHSSTSTSEKTANSMTSSTSINRSGMANVFNGKDQWGNPIR